MKLVNADMLHLISGGDSTETTTTIITSPDGSYSVEVDITYEDISVDGTDVLAPIQINVEVTPVD